MKVQIQDNDALREIDPLALLHVATAEGWRYVEPFGRSADVFAAEGLAELTIPRTRELGDYPRVVRGVIEVICRKTGEDQLTLYRRLRAADHDQVRFVAPHIQTRGAFGLANAVNAISAIRDILVAVGASVTQPRRVYSGRRLRAAEPLVGKFCLQQTDTGGFGVTLSYRPTATMPGVVSERHVTVRLLHALQSIRRASRRATVYGVGVYDRLVRHGVSANLCDALAGMINQMGPLGVHVTWAPVCPTYEPNTRFGLSGLDVGVLRMISKRYRSPTARLRDLLGI